VCSQIPTPLIPPTISPTSAVVQQGIALDTVARLNYLYRQALVFVEADGSNSLNEHDCIVYANMSEASFPQRRFVYSLAVAQDYLTVTKSITPVSENLKILNMLGETTTSILEQLLDLGKLAVEPLDWGIFGLSFGYMSSDPRFIFYKQQLHSAIESPNIVHKRAVQPGRAYPAMVRIVARVESRVCTTSHTKGHNHLKKDTIE
jgi:hypothetical protein